MTNQGTAHGRFTRAIQHRNLWAAETSLRELGTPTLEAALAYLDLLAEQKPEKLERAAVRWHGRLETEAPLLALAESQLALAALASLCAGERDSVDVLRRLLRRVRPVIVPRRLGAWPSWRIGGSGEFRRAPLLSGSLRMRDQDASRRLLLDALRGGVGK